MTAKKRKRTGHTSRPVGDARKPRPAAGKTATAAKASHDPVGLQESLPGFFERSSPKAVYAVLMIMTTFAGIVVYRDYLTFTNLFLFKDIGSDTLNIFYPKYVHVADYFREYGVAMWSFCEGMGQNIYPGSIASPIGWFHLILGREFLAYGLGYEAAIKVLVMASLAFFYLNLVFECRYTALVGALIFSFSGYLVASGTWYGHGTKAVYFVFALYCFERLYKRNSWILFPFAILLSLGSQLYFYGIFFFLYTCFRYISDSERFDTRDFGLLWTKLAVIGFLAILISSPFAAAIVRILQSPRVSGDLTYTNTLAESPIFALADASHYATVILRTFSSDLLGTGSAYRGWYNYLEAPAFYCGILTLVLFPQVVRTLNQKQTIVYAVFLGIWIVIIIFPYFRYAFYLFRGDYYKSALSMFVPFTLIFYSMRALRHIRRTGTINVPLLIATVIGLLLLLHFPYFGDSSPVNRDLQLLISVLVVVYAAMCYVMATGTAVLRGRIQWVLLAVMCGELIWLSSITVNDREALTSKEFESRTGYNDYTVEALDYIESVDSDFYRIEKYYSSTPANFANSSDGKVFGYYGTPSYSSFNQKFYIRFLRDTEIIRPDQETDTRWAPGVGGRPVLMAVCGVKYSLSKDENPEIVTTGYADEIALFNDVKVLKNRLFLPMGFTYDMFITRSEFLALRKFQKDAALLEAFVIEDEDKHHFEGFSSRDPATITQNFRRSSYQRLLQDSPRSLMKISEHSHNTIRGSIETEKRRLLFFSIPYDSNWSARIDGEPATVHLVNCGFSGVIVEPGHHDIALEYRQPLLKERLAVSAITVIACCCIAFVQRRRDIQSSQSNATDDSAASSPLT